MLLPCIGKTGNLSMFDSYSDLPLNAVVGKFIYLRKYWPWGWNSINVITGISWRDCRMIDGVRKGNSCRGVESLLLLPRFMEKKSGWHNVELEKIWIETLFHLDIVEIQHIFFILAQGTKYCTIWSKFLWTSNLTRNKNDLEYLFIKLIL